MAHPSENEDTAAAGGGGALMHSRSLDAAAGVRPPASPAQQSQGLQRFAAAKESIQAAFTSFATCLKDTASFAAQPWHWVETNELTGASETHEHKLEDLAASVADATGKCSEIERAIARQSMKVVFVGRTSNGKSTVINAMLHTEILPAGPGHTTDCFVTLMGSNGDTAYMRVPGSAEKRDVLDVQSLAHALLNDEELDKKLNIEVHWPRQQCHLLRDDVIILDSPGLDYTDHFDDWIDTTARDADVFVLVVNAISTLSGTESRFFEGVCKKIAKPNAFVLFNSWDILKREKDAEGVRAQHMKKAKDLLVDKLHLPVEDLSQRVFFVSAREVLEQRMGEEPSDAEDDAPQNRNGKVGTFAKNTSAARRAAFENFEEAFEEAISQHAVTTRFSRVALEGAQLTRTTAEQLRAAQDLLARHLAASRAHFEGQTRRLVTINNKFNSVVDTCRQIIETVPEQLRQQLLMKIQMQVEQKLPVILSLFHDMPFDEGRLDAYKSALNSHIETYMKQELNDACGRELRAEFEHARQTIAESVKELLATQQAAMNLHVQQSFDFNLGLNCSGLTENFREDLAFHFSWGWSRLAPQLLPTSARLSIESLAGVTMKRVRSAVRESLETQEVLPPSPTGSVTSEADGRSVNNTAARPQAAASVSEESAVASLPGRIGRVSVGLASAAVDLSLHTPYGLFAVATVPSLYRALRVGWVRNTIMAGLACYSVVYAFEYLTYNNSAKEKRFKAQFGQHAMVQLKGLALENTSHNSFAMNQELSRTFSTLIEKANTHRTQLENEIAKTREELAVLERRSQDAERLRKQASTCCLHLEMFSSRFLAQA